MKCICSQKDLKEALIAASKALPTKPQTPILNNIYFCATQNTLEIQATDFSTGIIAKIPAEVEIEGEVVIPGKKITEIIGKMFGAIITLSTEEEENLAVIKSGTTTFSLYTSDSEEFPKVATQEYNHSFYIKNEYLKQLIARSTFATANDTTRPIFQGCSITINGSDITFVATNTHRLILAKSTIEDEIPGENKLIVHATALNDVLSILNATKDERGVKVDFSDKHIAFTINNIFLTCRLIDGEFPPHDKVFPASCATFASVPISKFLSEMSLVETVSRETEYNTVRLKFNDEGLALAADSYGTGKVLGNVNAEVTGPNIDIAFNLRYIQDFLKIAEDSEEVRIGMNEPLSPAEFRFPDKEDIIYVITPVRV